MPPCQGRRGKKKKLEERVVAPGKHEGQYCFCLFDCILHFLLKGEEKNLEGNAANSSRSSSSAFDCNYCVVIVIIHHQQ